MMRMMEGKVQNEEKQNRNKGYLKSKDAWIGGLVDGCIMNRKSGGQTDR